MSQFDDVQAFVRGANLATRADELHGLLDGVTRELGFDFFSVVQHVDLRTNAPGDFVHLLNYPKAWQAMILDRGYFAEDPVHVACQQRATGFLWSSIGTIIPLSAKQREILGAAEHEGLGDGFAVPIHIPGESGGSCSFGMKVGRDVPQPSLPAAQYVGCFGFEAARRIHLRARSMSRKVEPPPKLSTRQLDCMVLAAAGLSDSQIAKRLGIGERTVHQHVEEAKHRYEVNSRTLLVVRALFDGQLTFADIFRGRH